MAQDRDSQIRERAHAIWLEEGMPEGQAEQHWNRAESEFADDEASATITPASAHEAPAEAPEAAATVEPTAVPETTSGVSTSDEADPAPVAPDVEAITEPAAAPPAAATKKQTRRKVKPVTPVR